MNLGNFQRQIDSKSQPILNMFIIVQLLVQLSDIKCLVKMYFIHIKLHTVFLV